MGKIVVGCLYAGFVPFGMAYMLLDVPIIKKILYPVFEWLRNLFWRSEPQDVGAEHFVVSEYLARIEKENLEILESREPVEQIVILWWGLDGLRLNEDGTTEQIGLLS